MADPQARRRVVATIGTLVMCASVGCAGIPDSGSVHVGRPVTAAGGLGDVDVRVLPPPPLPGATTSDIVHGFLRAMVNADGDFEIARSYLTRHAAANWHPGVQVTTYDDSSLQISPAGVAGSGRAVRVTAPRVGLIDERGDFTPTAGTVRATYQLTRQDGQWRIDRLPAHVLMSTVDALRAFHVATVYYLNRDATRLVPEQLLLRPLAFRVATALVRELVSGPGPWLAPAVRSAFPRGTDLIGNVPVDLNGVAEVNLSGQVREASRSQLRELSAQIVWTLRGVSEINSVRILVDGAPLRVPGAPAIQPRTSWQTFDPAAPPLTRVAVYGNRGAWHVVGGVQPGFSATARGWESAALSADGRRMAGVVRNKRGPALVTATVGGPSSVRLRVDAATTPTFDSAGNAYAVVRDGSGQRVVVMGTDGVRTIDADAALTGRPVQTLRLSRDGTRVAAIVGPRGAGRLLVGRVTATHGVPHFGGFRNVLPTTKDIRGISWDGGDQLVVTAPGASGRELLSVDVDGYGNRTIPTSGLVGEPVNVAAAPGRPILVSAGGAVWQDNRAGGWTRIGAGGGPRYAG